MDIQKSENAAVAESASRSKIQLEEPDEESQLSSSTPSADGTWKTISGRAIVSSEKLLEKLDESVSCRFCQGRVQVMENVATKHGLGSTWRIQRENESCPSHKTNSVFNSFKFAAGLAQVERLTAEREVAGSIPRTGPTLKALK